MPTDTGVNILLVDDQPNNLLALQALLAPLGARVVTAPSGPEALRRLLDQDFALILLDVRMPGMDGLETAALVRERDRSRHTPIIFLTGFDSDLALTVRGYALGAVDFLQKPIVPEVLRSKVGVFIELHQKTEEVKRQAELLREAQRQENDRRLAEEKRRWEVERLREETAREKQVSATLALKAAELAHTVAERVRAEERLRERARQQALVAELGQRALAGLDPEPLLREAVVLVAQTLGVEYCLVLELQPDGDTLLVRAGVGWGEDSGRPPPLHARADQPLGYALAAGEPIIVEDFRADPRFTGPPLLQEEGVVSGITVAIPGDTRPYGLLTAQSSRQHTFSHDDGHFLQALANVLAAALQRKRNEGELAAVKDELAAQLADMTRLHQLSARLSDTLDLGPVLHEVLRAVTGILDTDMGLLLLHDAEHQELFPGASTGLSEEYLGQVGRLRTAEGTLGGAVARRDQLVIEDVDHSPLFLPYRAAARLANYRGFYSKPLLNRAGTLIGTLTAYFREARAPTGRQLRLVDLYARQAAEAVDNARLYREIQDANRYKDEFLAMLAHELRNPLAPVLNALGILRAREYAENGSRKALDIMERQVRHMTRLIDDLLDVSRLTRGKIELRKELLELSAVVGRAVESTRPHLEARGHRLDVALPDEPVRLEADPTRLEQVLANLLHNAAKYTDPGGQIWLTAERDGDEVAIHVRDTGIGIGPELLPRVFDLFMQGNASLDRAQGGLGIGLTLVKNLVKMHGGSVLAHSPGPGRGSEFVVRLRALPAPVPGPEPPGQRPPAGRGRPLRILVVDDNDDAAQSLAMLLGMEGHLVRTAADGTQALEAAPPFRPEVVFLDIGLPGMSGYEVARRLREMPGLGKFLLVAMTGYGQEQDRRRSLEAGFDCHLVKPAGPEDVLHLLAECVAS